MTPQKAMRTMHSCARAMVRPAVAEALAGAFGRSLADLSVRPRPVATPERVRRHIDASLVIPIAELACALAGVPMELPYASMRSNLAHNTHRALGVLETNLRRDVADGKRPSKNPHAPLQSHVDA